MGAKSANDARAKVRPMNDLGWRGHLTREAEHNLFDAIPNVSEDIYRDSDDDPVDTWDDDLLHAVRRL